MGQFKVRVGLGRMNGPTVSIGEEIDLLVDTGATYTTVPADLLQRNGAVVLGEIDVRLADGSIRRKRYGAVLIRIEGRVVASTVLFGEPGDLPLLGCTTLEQAALGVDPVAKRLQPVQAIQAASWLRR